VRKWTVFCLTIKTAFKIKFTIKNSINLKDLIAIIAFISIINLDSHSQVQKLKGFKTFNYFGGYELGSITKLNGKYPMHHHSQPKH